MTLPRNAANAIVFICEPPPRGRIKIWSPKMRLAANTKKNLETSGNQERPAAPAVGFPREVGPSHPAPAFARGQTMQGAGHFSRIERTQLPAHAGRMRRTPSKKPSTSSVCRVGHEQRRALKKLAGTPRGLTEHLLIAHDFSVEMLSGLVQADLAAVVTEPMGEPRGVINMIWAGYPPRRLGSRR
jgi:hypothetical protein